MTQPLTVASESTIARVERSLAELSEAPEDRDLLLPTSLKKRQLGGTTAMLQLIATWRRRCPRGELRAYVEAGSAEEQRRRVEGFMTTDHALFAWALSERLEDRTGRFDARGIARELADKRLAAMSRVTKSERGNKVFLLCLDHERRFAAPETLYQPAEGDEDETLPRSTEGFRSLASELRTAIGGKTRRARRGRQSSQDDGLAALLRELVRNTHDWGRRHPDTGAYDRSVRGVRIELHNLGPTELRKATTEPVLADYLTRTEPNKGDRLHLVELSIFDSGPGLAAWRLHETGHRATQPDEYDAVRACLRTHFSSSHESPRGIGLHEVLGTITELGGLLRVRTGRMQLYRDFAKLPYDTAHDRDEPYLENWDTRSGVTAAPPVSGTFYTLLFPLPYADG
jgi:hypothetical protein